MLGLAKRTGARFLIASTSEVYGDPEIHPQVEEYWGNVNPIGVRSCYDEGKRVAETLTMDYHRQHAVDTRIVRIFNTYGPRMVLNDGRVVSNFVGQAIRGEPLTIYGDGTQTRSFCYVADLVEGMIRMMNQEETIGPVNIGTFVLSGAKSAYCATGPCATLFLLRRTLRVRDVSPDHPPCAMRLRALVINLDAGNPGEFTIAELAEIVKELVEGTMDIKYLPATPDDPMKRKPDISKAKKYLDWEPVVPLREGLKPMVADFKARITTANGKASH